MNKRIRVPRWLSQEIAEYDIQNDFWSIRSIPNEIPPFSTTIYGDKVIGIAGGLDDNNPSKPSFMSQFFIIKLTAESLYRTKYEVQNCSDMITKRGCATGVFHYGHFYIFGGLNYVSKILKSCEKFCDSKWASIADMKECRKNASALSMTSDSIYVFGGSSNNLPTVDSIEQYSVSANRWNLLKIRLPKALCFLTTFKLDEKSLLILGGCTKERKSSQDTTKAFRSSKVWLFDILEPGFRRLANLEQPFMSLYPAFPVDDHSKGLRLILINEDGGQITDTP